MSAARDVPESDLPVSGLSASRALFALVVLTCSFTLIWVVFGRHTHGQGMALYASVLFSVWLLLLSYIDLRTFLLPDVLTLPLFAGGLIWSVTYGGGWFGSLIAALAGYLLVGGLAVFWRRMRGYEGIGFGDAKLLGAGLAWLQLTALPLVLLIASGAGLLLILGVSFVIRSRSHIGFIPFGPCIALGLWFCWCTSYFS